MAERWAVLKVEVVAGAPTFDTEGAAYDDATLKTIADGEPRALVRVFSEVKRDPKPPVIVTRFESEN